ncbi:glycine betaine ABC transporter substrate-binding protein [Butyricicoccus sp. Marseille-Q5471]|uniref:glycine betaine ABC transporter substrate-binding protein n=1 Tax=Butyricicoccus sp. Marseille-Q5471 TaxID=3039493 RepID=UPI0024BCDFA4|nr:glycine betaine ABC transporter substrate-binding protein [Butyricicoccus sp. Marseille-Q5471]
MKLKKIIGLGLSLVLLSSIVLTGCSSADKIVIGSKDFSENSLLGEMFAQLVEAKTDIKVDRKLNLGGTFVCFEAIKNGDIDIYPEYTGTGLTAQLKMDVISDQDEAYRVVAEEFNKQFDIKWLSPLGFNNTYTLAVTDKVYQQYGVKTFSDLAKISNNLVFGAEHEFFDRQDGYDGLVEKYSMKFKGEPKKMNVSLKYQAIGNGDMDVTDAFATDGAIKQYNLKVLTDDMGFFPPYYAAPIIKNATLEKHPELEDILNALANVIDDAAMTDLNYKVDVEGKDVAKVAKEFLNEKVLLD